MRFVLALVLIINLFSCQNHSQAQLGKIELKASRNSYSTNAFPVDISDIKVIDNKIFIADQGLGRFVVTDKNLNSFNVIGKIGYGPNEIVQPSLLIVNRDRKSLMIYDKERYKILRYWIEQDSLIDYMTFEYLLMNQDVILENDKLFFTTPSDMTRDVILYDLENMKTLNSYSSASFASSLFGRYLFKKGNDFISVSPYNQLLIETYDSEWRLKASANLSEMKVIKELLMPNQNSSPRVSGSVSLKSRAQSTLSDALIWEGILYLLIYEVDANGKKSANTILVLEEKNSLWREITRIDLPKNGSYSAFSIFANGKNLIAFDRRAGNLELFEFKE